MQEIVFRIDLAEAVKQEKSIQRPRIIFGSSFLKQGSQRLRALQGGCSDFREESKGRFGATHQPF